VLDEVSREGVEVVVVAGDTVGGPLVVESLELLRGRVPTVHWVAGNSEREAVAAYDGAAVSDDPAAWSAQAMGPAWRDELGSWPISVVVDGVCVCHGSPRRDDEILTRVTPEDVILDVVQGVGERLIVGGHTHQQFVRRLSDGRTFANAGSVGLPYEGRAAAFWMVVEDGEPSLRATEYDVTAALEELRASGYPSFDDHVDGSLVAFADPAWVAAFFEHTAGRGSDPGPPRLAG
jgi:predicted phosphodiesterase